MSNTQQRRSSGLMVSQKSVDTSSISAAVLATPPTQVRRRSAAREAESDTPRSVALRLRSARDALGRTQITEGVSAPRSDRGETNVTVETLQRIDDGLGVTLANSIGP